jgi:opacity protein-like surface antigen
VRGFLFGCVLGSFGLLSLATASAADLTPAPQYQAPAPYVAPPGRRLECYGGFLAEAVISHPDWVNVPVLGATQENFAEGARAGGVIGCDIMFPSRMFLGLDATAVYGSAKGTLGGAGPGLSVSHNVPFESAARVRLGYMLDDQFSVYAAGGFEVTYAKTMDSAGLSSAGTEWGGQVAVGMEYRYTMDWRLRAEYAFTWPGLGSVPVTGEPFAAWNPTEHLIRLAAIRRF